VKRKNNDSGMSFHLLKANDNINIDKAQPT
jgi:hypothetical protein